MGRAENWHYVEQIRYRYHVSSKSDKRLILNEFCEVSGYHRKYAIHLLHKGSVEHPKSKRGRKSLYHRVDVIRPLQQIWLATDMMCGKRLAQAIPIWLPHYEHYYGEISEEARQLLLSISAATIDRLLQPFRGGQKPHGLSGTRPGYLLRSQIPIKTDHWDVEQPGFMEADTVAHSGDSIKGDFVWSITLVDIYTGWTEVRATWNKGSKGVCNQIHDIELGLPFALKGFDSDNGSEFLNYHLLQYLQDRNVPVQFTRSRPYKKNDNAHVEQKNWTSVRHIFGYYRLDQEVFVALMNDIYKNEWRLLLNFFHPSMKLVEKVKVKSKYRRKYDRPMTPYQRLLISDRLSKEKKKELSLLFQQLNPFELKQSMEKKLKKIFAMVETLRSNPKRNI